MTQAQKTAKAKFKQAIAYRQKTGVSLKEAFAHIYGKKVGVIKKSAKKKIGALPIGFKGNIFGMPFKIVNQYDIYNDVSAIMEDTNTGGIIAVFDGKGSASDKAKGIVSIVSNKIKIDEGDKKNLYSRMLKFATNMQKEVKDYNAGKKTTIKKQPIIIPLPKSIKMPIKRKVAKKVIRKVAKKKIAKKVVRKKLVKKQYNLKLDKLYSAKKPGKRKSASGKTYYENRPNRTDINKFSGIGSTALQDLKEIINKENKIEKEIANHQLFIKKTTNIEHKNLTKKQLVNLKKYLKELKIHNKELKKLI